MNEEQGIGKTIDTIPKDFFNKHGWDYEIIIVDGDSQDKTQAIAQQKGAIIIIEKRRGYGRAYKTGIPKATGDIIVTGDADATYPFDRIHDYIQILLDEKFDFLTTNRFIEITKGSMSLKHRFGNLILAFVLRLLYFINIKDSQSGMWIFKKESLAKIQPLDAFHDGMPFSEEIKIEMFTSKKVKAKEIPSTLYIRQGEVKLQSFSDGWKNLRYLLVKRIR